MNTISLRQRLTIGLWLALTFIGSTGFSTEYLVKYKSQNLMNQMFYQSSTGMGMQVKDQNEYGSYVVVDINEKKNPEVLAQLMANMDVEWLVPNFKITAFENASILTTLKDQWAITKVQAQKAWTRANNNGKKNITIAVIDTGIDYRHKDLAPNMVAGYDFRDNDADPMDEIGRQNPGHGTHCAGIASATGLIEGGITGVGPGVSIMPIRFLGADGSGDLNNAIKSIDFAIQKKVQVISASWGATVPRSQAAALIEAVNRADDAGIIFVTAAANDGRSNDVTEVYPANSGTPNMITVAASGSTDAKPSWSNYGKAKVSLAAPGEKIISTLPGDKYGELSGTSMATPLVAGLVAFLKSQDESLTGAQIRSLLQTTGSKVAIETACNCRVDAFAAVDSLLSKKTWIVPAAATMDIGGTVSTSIVNGSGAYTFTSSNPEVATIDNSGVVKGIAKGTTVITAKDSSGGIVTSLDYNVGLTSNGGGGEPGQPGQPGQPPGMDKCPIDNPQLCDLICKMQPTLPFCKK